VNEPAALYGIEPLGKHHDRAAFSCGDEALDRYIRNQARQDHAKDIARVFVAVGPERHEIAGFYTLSSYTIDLGELPDAQSRRLPRYPEIPAALIGRLAVARDHQGKGLGEILLIDALRRIIETGETVASYCTVVHAINERAVAFYRKYGFIPFPRHPNHLFLPAATARQLF
jgi:GNAT superfamily N-acetyltransferase